MQRACVLLFCYLWSVWMYRVFTRYLTNGTIFGKKNIEYNSCVLIFSSFFLNICHSRKKFGEIFSIMYIGLHVKYPLFLY